MEREETDVKTTILISCEHRGKRQRSDSLWSSWRKTQCWPLPGGERQAWKGVGVGVGQVRAERGEQTVLSRGNMCTWA